MKYIDLKKIKNGDIKRIALDILIDVAFFCDKNKIEYYLACGTLLGSIKYKGYIPWDDDIDIMMPRPSYNRFLSEYKGKYKVLNPSSGIFYYAKVYDDNTIKIEAGKDYKKIKPIGIDIDVFPLDGIINDEEEINRLMIRAKGLETLLLLSNQPIFYRKNPIKAINRVVPRLIGSKNIVKLIEKNAQTYKYEDSEYVIRMRNTPNGFTGALNKDVYYPPKKKEFEGHQFNVPNNYDMWLRRFYGDNYLNQEPPKEKQKPHHKNECYWK